MQRSQPTFWVSGDDDDDASAAVTCKHSDGADRESPIKSPMKNSCSFRERRPIGKRAFPWPRFHSSSRNAAAIGDPARQSAGTQRGGNSCENYPLKHADFSSYKRGEGKGARSQSRVNLVKSDRSRGNLKEKRPIVHHAGKVLS